MKRILPILIVLVSDSCAEPDTSATTTSAQIEADSARPHHTDPWDITTKSVPDTSAQTPAVPATMGTDAIDRMGTYSQSAQDTTQALQAQTEASASYFEN